MKTVAVINEQTHQIENTILLQNNAQWSVPSGFYLVDISNKEVGIGFMYDPDAKRFTAPVQETPVQE